MRKDKDLRRAAIAALLFALSACSDLGPEDVVGTFELRSINGDPLPALDAAGVQWLGGSFAFDSDGSCAATSVTSELGQPRTDTAACTWALDGDDVAVAFPQSGATGQGDLLGETLTFRFSADNAQWPWVFRKS